MALARRHKDVAHRAATAIRDFWRAHHNAHLFHKPRIEVDFDTGILSSDMKNGWPPLRS